MLTTLILHSRSEVGCDSTNTLQFIIFTELMQYSYTCMNSTLSDYLIISIIVFHCHIHQMYILLDFTVGEPSFSVLMIFLKVKYFVDLYGSQM